MKTLLKNSLTFLLMLMPVLAFAQQAPQIMNVSARQKTSLDGQWKTIVDPFENGYYDYRLKPYDGGYAQDKTYSDKTKLQEYDFETVNREGAAFGAYEDGVCIGTHSVRNCIIMKEPYGTANILNTPCSRASAFS